MQTRAYTTLTKGEGGRRPKEREGGALKRGVQLEK